MFSTLLTTVGNAIFSFLAQLAPPQKALLHRGGNGRLITKLCQRGQKNLPGCERKYVCGAPRCDPSDVKECTFWAKCITVRRRAALSHARRSQGVMLGEILSALPFIIIIIRRLPARPPTRRFLPTRGGVRSSRIQSTIPPCAVSCLVDCLQPPCWAFRSVWHQHTAVTEKAHPSRPQYDDTPLLVWH